MRPMFPFAGAAVALALTLAFPAAGQSGASDRKALEEKVRALEAKQVETTKTLEALKASLEAAAPAATHAELKQKLELLEKQQAETKASLEAIRKEMSQRQPGPDRSEGPHDEELAPVRLFWAGDLRDRLQPLDLRHPRHRLLP